MTAAHEWLARASTLWWPGFADHLWQATLFALIVCAACLVLQRGPARLRYSFWLLASAKFLGPTALLVFLANQANLDLLWPFSWQENAQNTLLIDGITQPVTTLANSFELAVMASATVRHNELYCALTAVWLTGCLLLLSVWGMRRRRFLQALQRGRSMNAGREWQAFTRAKESLGLKTHVRLIISPQKTEPAVCRVWNPVVVLPESIAEHLDDQELEAIMLHELVHIKRHDNLIGNLQVALCALLWFHPLIWLISRKVFDEREQACDEKVLEIHCVPEAYASSILKVVRFCYGWNVAGVTGAGSGSNLRRRIDNIMSTGNKNRSASWTRVLTSVFVGLALVAMVAAGAYSRASNPSVGVVALDGVSDELVNVQAATAQAGAPQNPEESAQSGQTAQAAQPAQPSQPSSVRQPSQANPAAPQSQPHPPSQPSQPNQANAASQATASTPASSATAPSSDAQETSSGQKSKEKAKEKDKEVVKGGLIEAPRPVYPEEARKQKIEGMVTVSIVIDQDGKVASARAKSGPAALHGASVEAAYKARFKPTTVDGKPVKVAGIMTYSFVADEK